MNTTTTYPQPSPIANPFAAITDVAERLILDYARITADHAEAQARLADRADDVLVDMVWVCDYFGVDRKTARLMLADANVFCHGPKIKRFWKSEIIAFARRNAVKLKQTTL